MNTSPFQFFIVIGLQPAHNIAVLFAVLIVGVWTIAMSPGELDSALGMLLFVQMFLASSGFLVRARRGHFDPILTSTSERRGIVMAHWFVSIAPGVVGWGILTLAAALGGNGSAWSAVAGRRACAFGIVSAVAWAAGFAMNRGAAGALWMAALIAALLHRTDLLGAVAAGSAFSTWQMARRAAAVVFCPFLLLGDRPQVAFGETAAGVCAASTMLLWVWRATNTLDFYLRDRT
jgi:hypothetical protein